MHRNLGYIAKKEVKSMTVKMKEDGFGDQSANPDSKPQLGTKICTQQFKSFAESFRWPEICNLHMRHNVVIC